MHLEGLLSNKAVLSAASRSYPRKTLTVLNGIQGAIRIDNFMKEWPKEKYAYCRDVDSVTAAF